VANEFLHCRVDFGIIFLSSVHVYTHKKCKALSFCDVIYVECGTVVC
jgi:hypothetical protein